MVYLWRIIRDSYSNMFRSTIVWLEVSVRRAKYEPILYNRSVVSVWVNCDNEFLKRRRSHIWSLSVPYKHHNFRSGYGNLLSYRSFFFCYFEFKWNTAPYKNIINRHLSRPSLSILNKHLKNHVQLLPAPNKSSQRNQPYELPVEYLPARSSQTKCETKTTSSFVHRVFEFIWI